MEKDLLFIGWALIIIGIIMMAYVSHQFKQPYLRGVSSESIVIRFAVGFLLVAIGVLVLGLAYFTRGGT